MVPPTEELIEMTLNSLGLEYKRRELRQNHGNRRLPFSETRMILAGELIAEVAGNKILLRPGDRIEIPPNTKHSFSINGDQPCQFYVSQSAR